jgi:hypothetical protein
MHDASDRPPEVNELAVLTTCPNCGHPARRHSTSGTYDERGVCRGDEFTFARPCVCPLAPIQVMTAIAVRAGVCAALGKPLAWENESVKRFEATERKG